MTPSITKLVFVVTILISATRVIAAPPSPMPSLQLPNVTTQQLLDQAQKEKPDRVEFAHKHGAKVIPTPDGKSFFLVWYPDNNAAKKPPMILTFNGHGGYAFDEFYLWQPLAEKNGFGIIAVQWWLGQGEKMNDYYMMRQIYPPLEKYMRSEGITPGTVLAHGFSRGAANIYSLAFVDKISGSHFIGATLANAGKLQENFPENRPLLNAGPEVFAGTHWLLYCGMHDENPGRDGCQGMGETKDWLSTHGAQIDLFIQDPNGGHGGFHRNPDNIQKALSTFKNLLRN